MTSNEPVFLPGVDREAILEALHRAGGREISSGKFASPQSSASLAVNCFGAFLREPASLPRFPGLDDAGWPAIRVDIERQMRFPWSGGRHPWLDAAAETATHLIGIESKRFEPFRDTKQVSLSAAYDRPVWGDGMEGWCAMRDALRSGARHFRHLDAAQLVKHAFGLVTEARRVGKQPVLLYLFAEPRSLGDKPVSPEDHERHRREIAVFEGFTAGSTVRFVSTSYREWLATWPHSQSAHARAILQELRP